MTLETARTKAKIESQNGYVQHVNKLDPATSDERYRGKNDPNADYLVSDWYDSDTTVASFENGREL